MSNPDRDGLLFAQEELLRSAIALLRAALALDACVGRTHRTAHIDLALDGAEDALLAFHGRRDDADGAA